MEQTFKDKVKVLLKKHGIEKFVLICYSFILLKACEDQISVFIINHYPSWLGDVFSIIQSTQWLNWITFFVTALTCASIIYCFVKRNESISLFSFCFLVFLLLSYRNRSVWDYLCLPFGEKFDYRDVLDLLLTIIIFVELVIIIRHFFIKEPKKRNDANGDVNVGFVQNATIEKRDVGWGDYAKSITERIESMGEIKESFAIGISGSWGSGKTTFMDDIKQFLNKDKLTILDFEPWACTDSNQIIKEYFDSLSRYFELEDKKLAKKILTYADLVIDISSSSWISKFAKALKWVNKNSISGVKKQVEDRIKGGNTVVVFIDDLDRLGPDELYETLRLIRVTANFKNVIYIVAYDSLYVEELLTEKGITNGAAFIKKIINVEISLPGYEGHHIPKLLLQELSFIIKDEYRMGLEKAVLLKNKDNYITSIYLEGFRDVKRFANIFALNLSQILKNKSSDNIDFKDFFLIELLHYSYPKTYYVLKSNPLLFLIQEYSKNMYVIRKDLTVKAKEEEKQKALSEIGLQTNDFSEKSLLLLQLLFDENLKSKTNSIQNIDSFFEYFYYRNLEDKLSLESFKKAIEANSDDEIESVVREWCNNNNNIWLGPSISNRFKTFNTELLSEQNAHNYLLALIKFSRYITPGGLNNLMASLLKKKKFATSFVQTLSSFLKAEIKNEFPNNGNPLSWPMIFKALYTATPDDAFDGWENDSLLSNNDIGELKKDCFEYWMKNDKFQSLFAFQDILKKDSLVQKYLQASVVLDWYDPAVDERENYVLLGKEYIFQHLKCSGVKAFESFEKDIFKIAENMPDDYFYDIDEYGEYNWNRIRGMFANEETYIEFILNCVNGLTEEKMVEHLRMVGISKDKYEKTKKSISQSKSTN